MYEANQMKKKVIQDRKFNGIPSGTMNVINIIGFSTINNEKIRRQGLQ